MYLNTTCVDWLFAYHLQVTGQRQKVCPLTLISCPNNIRWILLLCSDIQMVTVLAHAQQLSCWRFMLIYELTLWWGFGLCVSFKLRVLGKILINLVCFILRCCFLTSHRRWAGCVDFLSCGISTCHIRSMGKSAEIENSVGIDIKACQMSICATR